jgi:hypothetical protein
MELTTGRYVLSILYILSFLGKWHLVVNLVWCVGVGRFQDVPSLHSKCFVVLKDANWNIHTKSKSFNGILSQYFKNVLSDQLLSEKGDSFSSWNVFFWKTKICKNMTILFYSYELFDLLVLGTFTNLRMKLQMIKNIRLKL